MSGGRIVVCVPSYRRANRVKTLERVYPWARLWVAESEADEYRRHNPGAEVVTMPDEVQGNVARARNHILDVEFGTGAEAVCMMDDDIARLGRFVGDPRTHYGYRRETLFGAAFAAWLEDNTALREDWGLKLWGVLNVPSNRLSHQGEPWRTNQVVLGPFSVHLRNPIRYDKTLPLKEDYDLFLQHEARYRGVLRVCSAWYENGGSTAQVGGCASMRSTRREREQLDALRRKWGGTIVRYDTKSKRTFDFNPIIKLPIEGV